MTAQKNNEHLPTASTPDNAPRMFRQGNRPWCVPILAIGTIGFIAWLDYATGIWLRIFPLYYLAIAFGAQFISMRAGMLLALLSSIAWMSSNLLAGGHPYGTGVRAVNFLTMSFSFLVVGYLIGRLRQSIERESDLSRRDPLTGLHNSRAFHEFGDFVIASARRTGTPLTLAFIDLDNFKSVNDRMGHHEGDRILREAGALMVRHFRESDLLARLGGDEFAVLLPNTDPEAAQAALERLRSAMESLMSGQGLFVTMSIGAVHFATAPARLQEAIQAADSLMYEVKRDGKNRVLVRSASRNS